jgi:hypothetical protein
MNNKDLELLCKKIENFNKDDQIEILKLIHNTNSNLISENSNGSFINIEDLPATEMDKIVSYVNYVLKKNDEIVNVENKKQILKNNINENK